MDREMKYRVNKYLLKILIKHKTISVDEAADIQEQLLETIHPPYGSIEEVGDFEEYRSNTREEQSEGE